MDREKLLDLEKSLIDGSASNELVEIYKSVIYDYCIEKGKPVDMTEKFASMVIFTPAVEQCLYIALNYFEKKYNVYSLRERDKRTNICNTILVY
jgi:hypothetical protein